MLNFMALSGFDCGGEQVLRSIKFVMTLIDYIFIIVPILLILLITIDFLKNVIGDKVDDMAKNLQIVFKRITITFLLFLVPRFVSLLIFILGNLGIDYANCVRIAEIDDLSQYKKVYKGSYDKNNVNLYGYDKENNIVSDPSKKNNDNESNSNYKNANKFFIGDSRFVGMKDAVNKKDVTWYCKTSEGYKYMVNEALVYFIKNKKDNEYYNLVINMGVNDYAGNENKYKEKYESIAKSDLYKNTKIILVSVNPVSSPYSGPATNDGINKFNKTIKNVASKNSNVVYCDTNKNIKFKSGDGLHYDVDTNKKIYNYIINNCL